MKALGSSFPQIYIHGPVRDALKNNTPIVALESTIIAHGMPFPQNLHNAKALQDAVIQNGATPATVAVIHGVPHVGLTEAELHLLATHSSIRKLALRDLPSAFANRHHGATTVSATMHISCAVGIPVFATGGIGGVHRDVHLSWDISADIHALATIPQLVVCAGAKSILDIPKTLEALESASVPVFVLNSAKFPAFYTRDSGMPSPEVVKSERHAASVFHATRNTLRGGALLAVPVPEQHESDASVVQNATEQALRDMKKESLKPNQVTPFLLKRIAEITSGTSIETNMQLARNNACVAARVAVHLAKFQKGTTLSSQVGFSPEAQAFEARGPSATGLIANGGFANGNFAGEKREPKLLVVGGTALDIHCDSKQAIVLHSSNPGRIRQCAGGVGKNVAEAAMRLGGVSVSFVSCVGDDVAGEAVLSILRHSGFETDCIKRYKGRRTGVCCIVHGGNRDLTVGVADFDDMFGENGTSLIEDAAEDIEEAMHSVNMVCMDANAGAREMDGLVRLCEKWKVRCWFEPTTSIKCTRIVEADALKSIAYMSPNETELRNIAGAVVAREEKIRRNESVSKSAVAQRSIEEGCVNESEMDGGELMPCARRVLVAANRGSGNRLKILCTRGAKGVTRYQLGEDGDVQEDHFPAVRLRAGEMKNTTGAGDCFTGRCIAGLVKGEEEDVAIREGIIAAARCCRAEEAVPFGQGFAAKL